MSDTGAASLCEHGPKGRSFLFWLKSFWPAAHKGWFHSSLGIIVSKFFGLHNHQLYEVYQVPRYLKFSAGPFWAASPGAASNTRTRGAGAKPSRILVQLWPLMLAEHVQNGNDGWDLNRWTTAYASILSILHSKRCASILSFLAKIRHFDRTTEQCCTKGSVRSTTSELFLWFKSGERVQLVTCYFSAASILSWCNPTWQADVAFVLICSKNFLDKTFLAILTSSSDFSLDSLDAITSLGSELTLWSHSCRVAMEYWRPSGEWKAGLRLADHLG